MRALTMLLSAFISVLAPALSAIHANVTKPCAAAATRTRATAWAQYVKTVCALLVLLLGAAVARDDIATVALFSVINAKDGIALLAHLGGTLRA